jgi:hypothetical protein
MRSTRSGVDGDVEESRSGGSSPALSSSGLILRCISSFVAVDANVGDIFSVPEERRESPRKLFVRR